jgi:gliding motility-associated-like protein
VYYVTGTNAGGCSATDSVVISVQQKQYLSLQPTTIPLCNGDSAQLHASGVDVYSWQPVSGLNNATIADPFAFSASTTTYTVTGSDINNCFTDTASPMVIVNPKPVVNIKDSLVTIASGATYLVQEISSDDVSAWQWLPPTGLSCTNCPQPVATLRNNIVYTLKVSNSAGCTSTDQITFITLCMRDIVYVPNTFSPNRDGVNDYFFPRANAELSIKSLRVYNRWGQIVFEKTNFPANCYSCGWDGRHSNKEQPSDVYIYIMELQCANGIIMQRKGDITLLR